MLLTTQYLEEADRLADEIVVIDHGRVIAAGTPHSSRPGSAGRCSRRSPADPADLPATREDPPDFAEGEAAAQRRTGRLGADPGPVGARAGGSRLDDEGIAVDDLSLRRPSLDEVFLAVTGPRRPTSEPRASDTAKGGAHEHRHPRTHRPRERRLEHPDDRPPEPAAHQGHPEQLVEMTIQPLMFLVLFVFVFGGAIAGSSSEYLQFALPGDPGADAWRSCRSPPRWP